MGAWGAGEREREDELTQVLTFSGTMSHEMEQTHYKVTEWSLQKNQTWNITIQLLHKYQPSFYWQLPITSVKLPCLTWAMSEYSEILLLDGKSAELIKVLFLYVLLGILF